MKVRFTARALDDLARIEAYIRSESPAGAKRVGARLEKGASDLALFPQQGTLSRRTGLYRLYVTRTPYFLIYRIKNNEVHVVSIVHAKQKRRS